MGPSHLLTELASLVRVNVLIGVGLLADPLAFADAGWIFGTLILLFCALVTNCTLPPPRSCQEDFPAR